MWKIIKGTEEDFKGAVEKVTVLIDGNFDGKRFFAEKFEEGSIYYEIGDSYPFGELYGIYRKGHVVAERVWVDKPANPRRRKARQKPPTRTQTSLHLLYKGEEGNDLSYTLKNVVSFVIRSVDKRVNVTYKEDMGKVVKRVNVSIPFSELIGCIYKSPARKESFIFNETRVTNHIKFDLDENFVIQL